MIYTAEKQLKEHDEKLPEGLKKEVTEKIDTLKSLKDSDDLDKINGGIKEFEDALMKIGQEIYKTAAATAAATESCGCDGNCGDNCQCGHTHCHDHDHAVDPNNIDPEVLKQMMEQMQKQNADAAETVNPDTSSK